MENMVHTLAALDEDEFRIDLSLYNVGMSREYFRHMSVLSPKLRYLEIPDN